jgi:hypothetical protein
VTECQGCGAWNERHRALCVLCGTQLAEADEWDAAAELPPLPPLPDGGLSVSMPAWLRAVPGHPQPNEPSPAVFVAPATEEEIFSPIPAVPERAAEDVDIVAVADFHEIAPVDATPAEQILGPQADPRTFLRDEDFPRWIRELPTLPPRPLVPVAVIAPPPAADPSPLVEPPENPVPVLDPPSVWQETSQQNLDTVVEAAEELQAPTPSPAVAPPTDTAVHRREAWETPLLVVLVVGVLAAVIWALLVNGLIGNGL